MAICDNSTESINNQNLISADGFAYSPTIQFHQLDKLQADFQRSAVKSSESTIINEFVDLYGLETFNQSLISFNNFLLSTNINDNIINGSAIGTPVNTSINLSQNYPLVKDRLNKGVAITPIEFADFMEDVSYNPVTIQTAITTGPKNVLSLYNSHINGRFSKSAMGTFCELAPSIFGAVAGFFTNVQNFANKITDIINKIQNFSLAGLITSLKNKIMNVIENTINKVKKIIENFSIEGLISDVNKFFHDKVIAKFHVLKDKAMKFFEKDNIENFKKKIEGLISYATGIFKDPKLEEIQFLIQRFCSFITQVEDIINSIRNPLDNFTNRYVYAGRILGANSGVNTAAAVAAGAKRLTTGEIESAIARGIDIETARGNQPPPNVDEYRNLPQWNDGAGDSRVGFRGGWTAPPPPTGSGMGSEGWTWDNQVFMESKVYLMRVYKEFSRRTNVNKIIINSAYRSPRYNQQLRDRGVAAARNSKHMQGIAFDVTWNGYPNNRDVFIEVARSFGFKGIGIYSGFTHIDRRATPYSWNG
jgi:hypothetical protein